MGIDTGELTGMDKAMEHIACGGAIFGLKKQRVPAMQNGLFQSPFANIVIKRSAGYLQESGQFMPALEHVLDGIAKARIRLDFLLIEHVMRGAAQRGSRRGRRAEETHA